MIRLRRVAVAVLAAALVLPAWDQPAMTGDPGVVAAGVHSPRDVAAAPKDRSGRTLLYVEGQSAALRDAAAKVGGDITTTQGTRAQVAVPPDRIDDLATQPGVTDVRRAERAVPMAVESEGVALSGADAWHAYQGVPNGYRGAGVKIGVIDVGFDGLTAAQTAGELPNVSVNNSNCRDVTRVDEHGTAVAEVVHDMAPDSALFLACVDGPLDFGPATDWLRQQGVQVITAAVGFLTSGRGDGTGEAGSPADVVRSAREAGILWSVAAGNLATGHYGGTAAADTAGWVTFAGSNRGNAFTLPMGTRATVGLRWDAWPKTREDLDLYVMRRNHAPDGPNDPDIAATSLNNQRDVIGGARPTEEVTFSNDEASDVPYYVYVKNFTAQFTKPFDLFVSGTSTPLQYFTKPGSITEPATSPYVMAVGATQPFTGTTESYSSRGPTIDGRAKPDIVGFDKVSTSTFGDRAFSGTSAGAAHVAGAAAVFKSANRNLDAGQLQSTLEARTNPKKADNEWGKGTLALGLPTDLPTLNGTGYTALPEPKRIQARAYTPGELFTLPVPDVPGDARAVVLSLAARTDGEAASVPTTVDVFPEVPTASSRPTTLRVREGGGFTATTVVARLGADRAIRLRAGTGRAWVVVDMQGYFSDAGGSTYFAKPAASRILDTRGLSGSPRTGALPAGEVLPLKVRGVGGVPENATAVAVNITGLEATEETWISAFGKVWGGETTNVDLRRGDRRTNQVVVGIADDGNIRLRHQAGKVGLIVDVVGWFAPDQGARYVPLPEPSRVVDTNSGTGGRTTPIGPGETARFPVGGVAGVSDTATGVALAATASEDSVGTELSVRSTDVSWSPVDDISLRQRETASAGLFTPLGASRKIDVRNERGQARVALDATGYFVGGPPLSSGAGNCVTPLDESGFTSVFDGRAESGLDAWQTAGTQRIRQDGCELVTTAGTDVTWYGGHTFGNDYTLRLDWKATTTNADSGVYLLFPNPGADPAVAAGRGLEVQTGSSNAGAILPGRAADANAARPVGEWNTYEITVAWNTVTVLLNGQKVNEYTTTDSARLNVNSFVGLQNSGTSDPVRFRNIRVKRNSPVLSGTVTGVNNRCLDLRDGNPDLGEVRMWDCNGSGGQVWTLTGDGTIGTAGRCLDIYNWGAGPKVQLYECHGGGNQQWVIRPDGTIVNPASNKCLTPFSGDAAAEAQVQPCTGRGDQVWRLPVPFGRAGALVSQTGRCVDLLNGDSRETAIRLWDCNGQPAQRFVTGDRGSLRVAGKCLDIADNGRGTRVALQQCTAAANQEWTQRVDGTVVNPATGRCLTTMSADLASVVEIQDCVAGKATQVWRMSTQALWSGSIVGVGGKCLDIPNPNNGTMTALYDCYSPPGQTWRARADGTIRETQFRPFVEACLDAEAAGGGGNGNRVEAWQCNANVNQDWVVRPDGTLVNPWSGRLLDADSGNTANGTRIQLWEPLGRPQQRWATPLGTS